MVVISGTPTRATLELPPGASGVATLVIGHAPAQGEPQSDSTTIAPGTSGSVGITPVGFGMMRVDVQLASADDTGTLTVTPPGPTSREVQGAANIPYPVVDPL